MNIIIPLGGKGERFLKNGFSQPKPLINIFEKHMIEHVLDNLSFSDNDFIFIFYNSNLDNHNFSKIISEKYPMIHLIQINDTRGAAETLFLGIQQILHRNLPHHEKCLILDCDTFYTEDVVGIFRNAHDNMVFYTKKYGTTPIYSYIEINDSQTIVNIKEKVCISDNANTGAYAFSDIQLLYNELYLQAR